MKNDRETLKNVPTEEAVVDVQKMRVSLDGHDILRDVSFSLKRNSISMLIGPNGSGKTTLIRTLMGLIPIADGSVRLFGKKPHEVRAAIGYVPQRFHVDVPFPITVEEFLGLTSIGKNGRSIDRALSEVGVPQLRHHLLASLSGGQLQRVLIARALLGKPQLLVLDEPSSNIDVVGSKSIYEHLDYIRRRYDVTIIIVSHEMDVVTHYADYVLCVNRRLLCAGTPREVLANDKVSELYGEELKHFHHHE